MNQIGESEADRHLPCLPNRASQGESLTIMHHSEPSLSTH